MIALTDYPGDTRVRREAEALVDRGDTVDVICPLTDSIGDTRELKGVRLHPTGTLSRSRALGAREYIRRDVAFTLRALVLAGRLQRSHRFQVVQVHTMPDFLAAAALIPKLSGVRLLLDVHDLVPELFATKFQTSQSSWVVRLTKLVERLSVRFADHALAVSEPHLDALVAHGNPRSKFTVVMNAPDPRVFARRTAPPPPGAFTLVYHGTVSRRHGLATAVQAVALARETRPDVRFEVVGDGDDLDEVGELVDELGLDGAVVVTPRRLPVEQLQPILDRATAGVIPMLNDSFTRHTLPVKLLEYVAIGLPVICSRIGTIEAYFDETQILFTEPGNAKALAERIVELHDDPAKARQLVENADRFLDQHSWEKERDRYYAVIDSLASR
jgi:glycosyltransferase involved in cell wall biosynthesis